MDESRRLDDGRAEEMSQALAERFERRRQEIEAAERERRARVTGVNVRVDITPNGIVIGNG